MNKEEEEENKWTVKHFFVNISPNIKDTLFFNQHKNTH